MHDWLFGDVGYVFGVEVKHDVPTNSYLPSLSGARVRKSNHRAPFGATAY